MKVSSRRWRRAGSSYAVPLVLLGLAVIGGVIVYVVMNRGREPRYAHLGDSDALFFTELSGVDPAQLADEIGGSRLVVEDKRDALRTFASTQLKETDGVAFNAAAAPFAMRSLYGDDEKPVLQHFIAPASAIDAATYCSSFEFDKDTPFDVDKVKVVSVARFGSESDRDKVLDRYEEQVERREAKGKKDPDFSSHKEFTVEKVGPDVLVWGDEKDDVAHAVEGLEKRRDTSLADAEVFKKTTSINRGDGSFAYFNVRDWWSAALSALAVRAEDKKLRDLKEIGIEDQEAFVKGLSEMLPGDSIGGLGLWFGMHESRGLLSMSASPLARSNMIGSGGEEIYAHMPESTTWLVKLSLLPDGYEGTLGNLRDSSPAAGAVIDEVREALPDRITKAFRNKADGEAIVASFEAALNQCTGHVVFGQVRVDDLHSPMVIAVGIKDKAAAHSALEELREAFPSRMQKEMTPTEHAGAEGFMFDNDAAVLFADGAAIFVIKDRVWRIDDEDKKLDLEEQLEAYWAARDKPLTESDGFSNATDGANPEAPCFIAFHPHAMLDVNDKQSELAGNRFGRAKRPSGPNQPKPQSILKDGLPEREPGAANLAKEAWIGISIEVTTSGLEAEANVGTADLMALVLLDKMRDDAHLKAFHEALDQDRLDSVFKAYVKENQHGVDRWDFQSRLDEESQKALDDLEWGSYNVERDGDKAVFKLREPGSQKMKVLASAPMKPEPEVGPARPFRKR